MKDTHCVGFLQWALPHLGMRWAGFRKVRKQVCKRVERRIEELELGGQEAYRAHLETHAEEWAVLDQLCRVTISRFYRDKEVFRFLEREVLPQLARRALDEGRHTLTMWSAGCGSGEEPYTLALVWHLGVRPLFRSVDTRIIGTDSDARMLERAAAARFTASSLKDLPDDWKAEAFEEVEGDFHLLPEYADCVELRQNDLRHSAPPDRFDLILCRNLAFTYWASDVQLEAGQRLLGAMKSGSALVLGIHEALSGELQGFATWSHALRVYRRAAA